MTKLSTVYFSIGSNLGNKLFHLQKSLFLLQKHVGELVSISNVYQSPAWGFESDDFYNACVAVKTTLEPHTILDRILAIETTLGRNRNKKTEGYAARTIDIDVVYIDEQIISAPRLTVPHPEIQNRRFVLVPLSDIIPNFYHPVLLKDTRNLVQQSPDKSVLQKTTHKLYKSQEQLFATLNFLTIEGNIGAGKTTLTKKIAEDFNAKTVLERFADNPFLPKFYEDQQRYAFPLEMSFLADRYQQFMDDTSQFDLFKNFMVSDYDIFKSLIFANVTLQKDEFNLYRKLFNFMYNEVKKPDIYVYLYQNTERLLQNIQKRGRDYEQNIAPEYLENINRGYMDFIKSSPERNNLIIDVSELDFVSNPSDYDLIISKIEAAIVTL